MTINFISVQRKQVILCALLICEITYVHSVDYCTLLCKGNKHTMCLYPKDTPGPNCTGYKAGLITKKDKELIVHLHNKLRNKVAGGKEMRGAPGPQPSASNMLALDWDDEIAKIAQRWAYQCTFEHDKCRNVKDSTVGQNIAFQAYSDAFRADFKDDITNWYNEVKLVNPELLDSFEFNPAIKVGHYTQMVYAETGYIGCGHVFYKSDPPTPYRSLLVCNYKPAGNVLTRPIYKKGKPATDCPKNSKPSKVWKNLCSTGKKKYDDHRIILAVALTFSVLKL